LSNLIRYDVLEYLKSHGISARELDEPEGAGPIEGCGINPLPNNGIELIYKSSCIRIRKGVDPPMPTTDSQKGWYQQELGLVFEDGSPAAITNLLVLWYSCDPRTFAGLKLIRTKRVLRKSVACDWEIEVPPPPIPLSTPILPDYSRGSDLPLEQSGEQEEADDLDGTGTDDHQW
jgi:hypothetical protein